MFFFYLKKTKIILSYHNFIVINNNKNFKHKNNKNDKR